MPNPKIDAVLPLILKDFERFKMLDVSLNKFFPDLGRLWIVTPDAEVEEIKRRINNPNYSVISESDIVPEFTAFSARSSQIVGWYKQQLIKLAIIPKIQTDFYITFDADVICTQPTYYHDLVKDGRAVCNVLSKCLYPQWYEQAEKVLRRTAKRVNIHHNVTPAVLSTQGVMKLRDYLTKCFDEQPPELTPLNTFPNITQVSETSAKQWMRQLVLENWRIYLLFSFPWTEYALYYTFLETECLFDNYHVEVPFALYANTLSVWLKEQYADWKIEEAFLTGQNHYFIVCQSKAITDTDELWRRVSPYLGYEQPAPALARTQTQTEELILVPKNKIYLPVPTRWRDMLWLVIQHAPNVFISRFNHLKQKLSLQKNKKRTSNDLLPPPNEPSEQLMPPASFDNVIQTSNSLSNAEKVAPKTKPILHTKPSVVVVIPTAGRFDITATLEALVHQTYPPQSVVIVESGSQSLSARAFIENNSNNVFKLIFEPRPGANIARNIGIRSSNEDIVLITDDDVIPSKNWVEAFVVFLETGFGDQPINGVVGGKVNLRYLGTKPGWCEGHFESQISKFDCGAKNCKLSLHQYLISASMGFHRTTYNLLGGFSELDGLSGVHNSNGLSENTNIIGDTNDEILFLEAAKLKTDGLYYCADAIADHQIPEYRTTLDYFLKRAYSQGKSDMTVKHYLNRAYSSKNISTELDLIKLSVSYNYADEDHLNGLGLDDVQAEYKDLFTQYTLLMRIAYLQGLRDSFQKFLEGMNG
jgi:glycosyltransferase involved in cell wall biosynthesis